MWISGSDYGALVERIRRLEERCDSSSQELTYRTDYYIDNNAYYSGMGKYKPIKDILGLVLRHLNLQVNLIGSTPERMELGPRTEAIYTFAGTAGEGSQEVKKKGPRK